MEIAVLRDCSNEGGPIEQTMSLTSCIIALSCNPASKANEQSTLMIDFALVLSINPSSPILISVASGTCFIKLIIVKAMIYLSYNYYIF